MGFSNAEAGESGWIKLRNIVFFAVLTLLVLLSTQMHVPFRALSCPWVAVIFCPFVGLLVIWILSKSCAASLNLLHVKNYPPWWMVSLALGFTCFVWVARLEDVDWPKTLICFWLAPVLFALPAFLKWWNTGKKRKREGNTVEDVKTTVSDKIEENPPIQELSLKKLISWLDDDQPVTRSADDFFEYAPMAKRIADRLAATPSASQALIGDLGSGKTTIRELVRQELIAKDLKLKFVAVELWPYSTTRGAVEAVLRSLIEALSEEVNAFWLSGLASKYADMIAGLDGRLNRLLAAFRQQSNPHKTLLKINQIASAIGFRIIVWIDDLERLAVAQRDPGGVSTSELAHLAPLRALLHGLDQLENITVLTATTSLRHRFDLEKIARYVESLHSLSPNHTAAVVNKLRKHWFDTTNQTPPRIDPAAQPKRFRDPDHEQGIKGTTWREKQNRDWEAQLSHTTLSTVSNLAEAIIYFCRSPRRLKQVLRLAHETWKHLGGEIDMDVVLAITSIRVTLPEAFSIINDRLRDVDHRRTQEAIRELADHNDLPQNGSAPDSSFLVLDRESDRLAVKVVCEKILDEKIPQGFAHRDYWERYLTLTPIKDSHRDQRILRAIEEENIESICDILLNSTLSDKLERFAAPITTSSVLIELFKKICDQKESEEQLRNLCSLLKRSLNRPDSSELTKVITDVYNRSDFSNLSFMYTIEGQTALHFFDNPPKLLDDVDTLKKLFRKNLTEKVTTPKQFISALGTDPDVWMLTRLVFGKEGDQQQLKPGSDPFLEWPAFQSMLVKAKEEFPEIMEPQIECLEIRWKREYGNNDGPFS